jgi:hypothetical protein
MQITDYHHGTSVAIFDAIEHVRSTARHAIHSQFNISANAFEISTKTKAYSVMGC